MERRSVPSLRDLMAWFLRQYRDEVPPDIHTSGVEWEPPGDIVRGDLSVAADPGGGSASGSPRWTGAFRHYVTDTGADRVENAFSDGTPEAGLSYALPMRATMARLSREGHPMLMVWARRVAMADGDYREVGLRSGIIDEYAEAITRDALGLLWRTFREVP
jgi:hypothetical protein